MCHDTRHSGGRRNDHGNTAAIGVRWIQRGPEGGDIMSVIGDLRVSLDAIGFEQQADQFTPEDPLYHWMIGLRLQNLAMNQLAEKHFQRAIQLDPTFQGRRTNRPL